MLAALFIGGLAAAIAGVALVSIPAALVVGGSSSCVLAVVLARGDGRTPSAEGGGS